MRKIVLFPNKILRVKTPEIIKLDEELLKEIESLKEVLLASAETGAGLAAPQIGISKRFFGMFVEGKREIKVVLKKKKKFWKGQRGVRI